MKILFATQNVNKFQEIRHVLDPRIELISMRDLQIEEDIPETYPTLEDNALYKARYLHQKYKIMTIADDTGLEVKALGGAPGVLSARYAGEDKNSEENIDKLLCELENKKNLEAQFRTIIALVNDTSHKLFEGLVNGTIIRERRGSQGFGYDPIFIPHGFVKTFAQMTLDEKNLISHRGRAIQKLSVYLRQYLNALNNT